MTLEAEQKHRFDLFRRRQKKSREDELSISPGMTFSNKLQMDKYLEN